METKETEKELIELFDRIDDQIKNINEALREMLIFINEKNGENEL